MSAPALQLVTRTSTVPSQAETLSQLKDIVAALEANDHALFEQRLNRLICQREDGLLSNVVRITRELHQAVKDINVDQQLQTIAHSGMPDAAQRLDHVVKMTEEATHKTLDLVDKSRATADSIGRAAQRLSEVNHTEGIVFLQSSIVGSVQTLREQLSALAQTQEYQDLTGQIIRRVIRVVRDAENALISLLRAGGSAMTPGALIPTHETLEGPEVPGLSKSTSQQDADALLAELGF